MKRLIVLIFIFLSFNLLSQEVIFSDTVLMEKIGMGIRKVYNFEFSDADSLYAEMKSEYPTHPFCELFNAIIKYWKYFPITPDRDKHQEFVDEITMAFEGAEQLLEANEDDLEGIFLNLMSRMLLMQYYADNHSSSKVVPHLGRAYKMVTRGFGLKDELVDFHFSTGVYNYYREAYPEAHPIYKPFAYFFPKGDKELGIQQLEYNWHNGVFLSAESLSFLVYINLNFEGDFEESKEYTLHLNKEYPNNPLYLAYRIQSLLLVEEYTKAIPLVPELRKLPHSNGYFKMLADIYDGILMEKYYDDRDQAKRYYLAAISKSDKYKEYVNNHISYAYFGLHRIWKTEDRKKARIYLEAARDLSVYSHITFD